MSDDEISLPGWRRALAALDSASGESARAPVEVAFHVDVHPEDGVLVSAWVQKLTKSGRLGKASRSTRRKILAQHAAELPLEDLRVVAQLTEEGQLATRPLLEALVDHPRVFLADDPDRPVRVDRAIVGVVAEDRNGAVRVTAGIDGTGLPPHLLDRARRASPQDALFVWDGGRLTLLDVKPELRSVLQILRREGELFPRESRQDLLASLSKWAGKLPVSMPRTVMGEAVRAEPVWVIRMEAQAPGAVEVSIRTRALPDAPAVIPGIGARDVHVRRGDKAFHTVRDLRAEAAGAEALVDTLPLEAAERLELPFHWSFEDAHGALALLAACEALTPRPELEWVGVPLVVLGSAGTSSLRVLLERRRDWFGLLGGLSVDGERVELARLLDTVRQKERFVKVNAHSYLELGDTLRAHLEALADHVRSSQDALEVGPSALDALNALRAEGARLDADDSFRDLAERAAAAKSLQPALPEGLTAELRPYQLEGYRWLSRLATWARGAILADDMGLGKTLQALTLLVARAARGPAIVVAPTSVIFNWREEAARFAPDLKVLTYAEAANREQTVASLGPGEVLLVSYGLLVNDADLLSSVELATAVFDEAQSLKNATSQRFQAARGLRADFRVALSGTPLENHLGELWALCTVVYPGLLGGWESFRRRYALPIEKHADPRAAQALSAVVGPFLLRRTKAEVEPELPPRTEVRVPVVLSSAEWALYEDTRLATLSDLHQSAWTLREQNRKVEVLAALTRLRLLASHPALYDPASELESAKLSRFLELAEELIAEGQRALVFSQFTSHLALVRAALDARSIRYEYLDGETPAAARGDLVQRFQQGDAPLFLISLKAGGFGLNLTAATNVVHLDPWWNPAVEDQASDRAHRLGQTRAVTIYRLIAKGTIEETMLDLHKQKRSLVENVLAGAGEVGRLSADDLLELLTHGRETRL